jgi:hypothetical protein
MITLAGYVGPFLRCSLFFRSFCLEWWLSEHSQRYQFALKIFQESNMAISNNEREAYRRLRNCDGFLGYFADYLHRERRQSPNEQACDTEAGEVLVRTTNILLEYGELDLDEYFAEHTPPVLQTEIEDFWRRLFEVAHAVEAMHNLLVRTRDTDKGDRLIEYLGSVSISYVSEAVTFAYGKGRWHADIKPDNILSVQGKFKLSDPGFALFVQKAHDMPKRFIQGGTETYGTPIPPLLIWPSFLELKCGRWMSLAL